MFNTEQYNIEKYKKKRNYCSIPETIYIIKIQKTKHNRL